MTQQQRWLTLTTITVLVIVGFALRLYQIGQTSLRGDEAFTVIHWIEQPLRTTITSEIPTTDPQPVLAYAVYHIWGNLLGTEETTLRLLPALIGTLIIPALYALGARIAGWRLGLVAAALATFHPFLIWHAQDARNYALWATASALALWLGLRALEKRRRIDQVLYILAATIAAYLYYLELFFIATLTLYVLLRYFRQPRIIFNWTVVLALIGLLLAPWYLQPRLLSGGGYGGTAGAFDPAQLVTWFLPALMFGRTLPSDLMAWLGPLLLVILVVGAAFLWRYKRWYALLLALLGTLPLLMLSVVSLRLNVFTPRYVLAAAPVYILLFGMSVLGMYRRQPRSILNRAVGLGLLFAWIAVTIFSLNNHYHVSDYAKAPDWRGLTAYLHTTISPEDIVIQTAADEAFTYYYAGFTPIERLPANPIQSDAEIADTLATSQDAYDSVWLVASPPPSWSNAQTGQNWLDNHMQLIRSLEINGLPVRQYMPWDVPTSRFGAASLATFPEVAHLRAAQIQPAAADEIIVLAYWQAIAPTDTDFKVFVHLTPIGSTAPLAQDDQFLQDGRIAMTGWMPEKIYRDVYHIPVHDLPPGDYRLYIGLYDPETGTRLTTEQGDDAYMIGTITLP